MSVPKFVYKLATCFVRRYFTDEKKFAAFRVNKSGQKQCH